ncbi:MAG TPA: hypothetical protein VJU86_11310 [Pyrinomonadaceae bacterium]|nr:hypothetical protein [Pyrinomonadaceae bacterium]
MSYKRQCTIYIKNATSGLMSLTGGSIDWGSWATTPPLDIASGTVGYMHAQGTGAYATGTGGSVVYTFADNATTFTVTFEIPFDVYPNTGGGQKGGTSPNEYTAMETDSDYKTQVSFPSGGNTPTVYFIVGNAPSQLERAVFQIDLESKIANAEASHPTVTSLNIAEVARAADCGVVSSDDLVKMFKGKTEATVQDILAADNVAPSTRVYFVSDRNLISQRQSFTAAVDFAASYLNVLTDNPEVGDTAQEAIALLRAVNSDGLEAVTNNLERAKLILMAPRGSQTAYAQIAAIEAILACIYMAPGAAMLQAGSCAQQVTSEESSFEAIAKWQLEYLQKALTE